MKSARLYVCLSIALCFLLLILNQTSGCCLTTLGGIHNSLHSFLAASSTGGSANRQCCSDFSSVALAAH